MDCNGIVIFSEPLMFEQANNVLRGNTFEIGINDFVYQKDDKDSPWVQHI